MNILVSICLVYFFFIGCICRSRIASSYGRYIFSLEGNCHLFSVIVILITTPLAMCKNSHIHTSTSYFLIFLIIVILTRVKYHCNFYFSYISYYKQNKSVTLISGNCCNKSIDLCRTYKLSSVKRWWGLGRQVQNLAYIACFHIVNHLSP